MEEFDRVSNRVTLVGGMGAIAGVAIGMYKGHPLPRTSGLTAVSCALAGTACFGAERFVSLAGNRLLGLDRTLGHWERTFFSHVVGGSIGGALLGALYMRRPIRGVVFFTPVMMVVALGEVLFEDLKNDKLESAMRNESGLP
jgi:hypothetical protein